MFILFNFYMKVLGLHIYNETHYTHNENDVKITIFNFWINK